MNPKKSPEYTGAVWSSELKNGTAYRISLDFSKIKDIEPDAYGNIAFSVSKRKEPHAQLKSTHNIYLNLDPQNYLNDRYALINLSLSKKHLSDLVSNRGYCDIIALPLSKEAKQKDHAKASYIVTSNVSLKEKDESVKRATIGKAWNIFRRNEKSIQPSGDREGQEGLGKIYVGNGMLKDVGGVKYINILLDQEKFKKLETSNDYVYVNLATKKGKDNEFSVYYSPTKYDKWAQFTVAFDKEKVLSINPSEHGYLPISLSYKKDQSIGRDKANLNVKDNSVKDNIYVGKAWSRENMYWLNEHSEEIDQTVTLEKSKGMEGKGLTNKGLHFFQTVKIVASDESGIENQPDTSNSYYLKDGLVFHEKAENSILPKNGYPFEDFVLNYESLKENYHSSTFYNVEFLPEKEKEIFFENSPFKEESIVNEKKNPEMSNSSQSEYVCFEKDNKVFHGMVCDRLGGEQVAVLVPDSSGSTKEVTMLTSDLKPSNEKAYTKFFEFIKKGALKEKAQEKNSTLSKGKSDQKTIVTKVKKSERTMNI